MFKFLLLGILVFFLYKSYRLYKFLKENVKVQKFEFKEGGGIYTDPNPGQEKDISDRVKIINIEDNK